jgi:hypothetical protein
MEAEDTMNARVDPIQAAGRLYAGDLDVAHPYVSPLNGEFRGLAPMIIFSGTREAMSRYRMTPAKTEMVAGKLYATRNVWAGARAGANASCSACRSPRFVRRAADFTEASLRRHPADPDDSNDNCRVSAHPS